MNILIGIDFSINKPAASILKNNTYHFISWPYNLSKNIQEVYEKSPLNIVKRTDIKNKGNNITEKMRYEIENAKYLSNLMVDDLSPYLSDKTIIGFEGLSYGSFGDVMLQLSGYKFILMNIMSQIVPLKNMFTYSPITIKKTAGCSKKGMKKADMIEVFKTLSNPFSKYLRENERDFKTRKENWIVHLDDIVDAYFTLKTLQQKENF